MNYPLKGKIKHQRAEAIQQFTNEEKLILILEDRLTKPLNLAM